MPRSGDLTMRFRLRGKPGPMYNAELCEVVAGEETWTCVQRGNNSSSTVRAWR